MPFDLITWVLVFLRVGALLAFFPLFSMSNFPVRLRVALAALTALLVTPWLPPLAVAPKTLLGLTGLMASEIGIGLLLGFIVRLLFFTVEFAGSVISMEIGLNMAASMSPMSSARSEVPGLILFYLAAMLFLALDLHHWILVAFQRSYQVLPIGGAHLGPALLSDLVGRISQLFVVGVLIAAPVIAVAFLVNLVFSVIGRAVPQVNIFIESFAFRILTGMAVLGLTLPVMSQHIVNYLRRLPDDLMRVAHLLGSG